MSTAKELNELRAGWLAEDKERRHTALDELLDTVEGRQLLWWLLEISKAMGQNPYRQDDRATVFVCGEMNVGQQLLAEIIETNQEGLLTMMREQGNVRAIRTSTERDLLSRLDAEHGGDIDGGGEYSIV